MPRRKYAMITPYYTEDRSLIEKCIHSVKSQSVSTDHIVVSDGVPQDWIDDSGVRHIRLDRNHADYGNTPRALGALLAIGEEYDGIGLLDADNWIEPDHVGACLEAGKKERNCDYVVAQMILRRPDGSILPVPPEPGHVDTNCFFFLRGSFSVVPYWGMMPKLISHSCDRVFNRMIIQRGLVRAFVQHPTVNYLCMWETFYKYLGEKPPKGAKPNIDASHSNKWLRSLTPRELEVADRLAGLRTVDFFRP